MTRLIAFGIFCAVAIGAVIGLLTAIWLRPKRLPPIVGALLVFALCLAYHGIAAIGMGSPVLHILTATIIVPFGYGFGEGNAAFWTALLVQATIAGIIGISTYLLINKRK
jgi:hypothetical protein